MKNSNKRMFAILLALIICCCSSWIINASALGEYFSQNNRINYATSSDYSTDSDYVTGSDYTVSGSISPTIYVTKSDYDDEYKTLYWKLEKGVLTIWGEGKMVEFAASSGYYDEKNIAPWRTYDYLIREVIIENGVKSIGSYAFYGCDWLESVIIGDTVTSIGNGAFKYCGSLKKVTIPDSVTSIGKGAFYDCYSLTSVTIPDSVISIGKSAFYYCSSLTSIIIPDSVTSIGSYAFNNCYSLTSIIIPDSVTSIGGSAFNYTGYSNNISNWENAVLYIGNHLIRAGRAISGSYTIKTGTKTIADSAFYDCYNLTGVTIPDSVTRIGYRVFHLCRSLTNITIPNSITSIDNRAFTGCDSLTDIFIDVNNTAYSLVEGVVFNKEKTEIIYYPPGKEASTYTIPDSVESISSYAFSNDLNLQSIIIPDSVKTIEDYGFYNVENYGSMRITIPNSVTSIGYKAFYKSYGNMELLVGCGSYAESYAIDNHLSYIINEHVQWQYLNGASDEKGGIKYVKCDKCGYTETHEIVPMDLCYEVGEDYAIIYDYTGSQNHIIIPSKIGDWIVTEIKNYAFQFRKVISKITLPETIKRIGVYAFDGCNKLKEIIIPNSTEIIGSGAFSNCTRLSSVVIGTGILKIESFAFEECANLETVVINGFPTEIGEDAFYGCDNVNVTSNSLYVSEYCDDNNVNFKSSYNLGDSNGDGEINVLDLIRIKKQALGDSTQTASADVNGDYTINALDIVKLRRQILGIE